MRIIKTNDEPSPNESGPINFLIYGDTGSGKTFALQTLPESMLPALVLDFDRGSRHLRKTDLGTIVQFDIELRKKPVMYDQARDFLEDLAAGKKEKQDLIDLDEVKTIVVDSFTTLIKGIQDRTMQWFIDNGRGGNSRSSRDSPPTQAEYGMIAHLGENLIRGIIGLDKHTIVICHEASKVQDEVTGLSSAGPALQRSLAIALPRYFDEVLYAKAEGKADKRTFHWHTKATGQFVARSRHDLDAKIPQDFSKSYS